MVYPFSSGMFQTYPSFQSMVPRIPSTIDLSTVERTQQPNLLTFHAPTPIGANRFVVIGDAGTGTQPQYEVARQMSLCHMAQPFASVLVLGDNVYPSGKPQAFYERIYQPYQDLFNQGVKFWPVLGNHDVNHGFGDQQLKLWGVPSCYSFKLGPPSSEVEFFALDTTVMAPGTSECYINNPEVARRKAAIQMAWLERALAQSTAGMKVVFAHYPLYSRGAEAKPGRAAVQHMMQQQLSPLFEKYGVDLYMAGHVHHYEKPVQINGVNYLVSGAGGKLDTARKGGTEGNGLIKQNHFMLFDILPEGLKYQTISSQGTLLDSGFIPRKRPIGFLPSFWPAILTRK
jgi:hypothetical protein